MAGWKNFEDIEAWQMARVLAKNVFVFLQKDVFNRDYRLKNQMLASSGSIMDNIAEGFERSGNKEFIQFLYISKGSAGELRSQFYRCFDNNYMTEEEFEVFKTDIKEIANKLSGIIRYLKSSDLKGYKYKK